MLLITDQGDIVQRFANPKKKARPLRCSLHGFTARLTARLAASHSHVACGVQIPKVYEVELDAELPADAEVAFTDGRIVLDGAPCAPAQLRRVGPRHAEVTLVEGKYHQVKRMFAAQARPALRRCSCVVGHGCPQLQTDAHALAPVFPSAAGW